MESILNLVKISVGVDESYDAFDKDLIMHINSTFMVLRQMGVGPSKGFRIEDDLATWTDFIPAENELYEGVKTYVCAKVRLMFDPPANSTLLGALNQVITEFEWRLNWEAELGMA